MCCTAWSGVAGGGAGKIARGTGGRRLLWGQLVSDVMHQHSPGQLGFVAVVHGSAWGGEEDEDEYLQWIFITQEPQPDEDIVGLGLLLSLNPSVLQGKT